MRLRNPLIALVFLIGLVTYVYLVEIRGGEERRKTKEASEHLLSIPVKDVTSMTLETRGSPPVRLEKQGTAWKIVGPAPVEPDTDAVTRVLDSLASLRISRDLGAVEDPAPYNLKDPPVRMAVKTRAVKAASTVAFGDDAPTGSGVYARLGDSPKVLVVTGAETIRSASLFSLRDKTFFRFDPARLTSFRILGEKEGIDLTRVGGKWRLTRPVLAPGDDPTISDLLYALERVTVTEFLEENPPASALAKRGLAPPRIRVILSGEEWKGEKELAFGNSENGSIYALGRSSAQLVRIADSVEAKLKSTVESLRRKEILPFSRYEISRLRLTGFKFGTLALLQDKENRWQKTEPRKEKADEDAVDLLLRNLSDLKVESFLDQPGGDLARYGLAHPVARLEFWTKDKEGGSPAVIEVGREDGKGKVSMKAPEWPSVMLVNAGVWNRAADQVAKVAQKPAPPAPPDKKPTASSGGSGG